MNKKIYPFMLFLCLTTFGSMAQRIKGSDTVLPLTQTRWR